MPYTPQTKRLALAIAVLVTEGSQRASQAVFAMQLEGAIRLREFSALKMLMPTLAALANDEEVIEALNEARHILAHPGPSYESLVRWSVLFGCSIRVEDSELGYTTDADLVIEEIRAYADEVHITIRRDGRTQAKALVCAWGFADDETIIDCSDNEFMQQFDQHYDCLVELSEQVIVPDHRVNA